MRVLQVPFTYYPDSVGGTEVYVEALVSHLQDAGIDSCVAAPGEQGASYEHEGIPVRRYPVGPLSSPEDVYEPGDPESVSAFLSIVRNWQPDLVHLHAHTRAVSSRLAEATKEMGIAVVLTYHTPTVSCPRGTLLHRGDSVCDGTMKVGRCASCVLQKHGVPSGVSGAVGYLPPSFGKALGHFGLQGGSWTALRMPDLIRRRHRKTRELFSVVDQIVAVCEWVGDVLQRNDVPASKITISRQGLPQDRKGNTQVEKSTPYPDQFDSTRPLRLIFLGRIDPVKGVDVVLDALRHIPEASIHLSVYGIPQSDDRYLDEVKVKADVDSRVDWHDPIPSERVSSHIQEHDALIVPSQWLETGPLVVYEAFAAGRPVVGSDLGGIAELVTDGQNGVLVSPEDDSKVWAQCMRRIVSNPSIVSTLQDGVGSPRTMGDAAKDMKKLYNSILF